MIPPEWRLRPPDGVSDEVTRNLLTLTEERLGAIPVDRALVWAIQQQPPEVLWHLADALGLRRLTWLSQDPSQLLSEGVAVARRLGTPKAVEEAVATLGIDAWCHEDTRLFCDGSIYADGAFVAGADRHWAMFWIVLALTALSEDQRAAVLALASAAKRSSAHLRQIYLVDDPSEFGDVSRYRRAGGT